MAYLIKREVMLLSGFGQSLPDFWQLHFPVTPKGSASKTDVMLVQALLRVYALSAVPRDKDKSEALDILNSQRGRFDDGIFGSRTRALLKVFENQFHPRGRDGIVQPSQYYDVIDPYQGGKMRGTLRWLNDIWDLSMHGGALGSTKKEIAQSVLNPILFSKLYES